MARNQLLAAATCRRAPIAMPRAYAALQLRTAHSNADPAKTGSPTAFLSKGRKMVKPGYRRIKLAKNSDSPLLEFKELAEKTKTNLGKLYTVAEQYPGFAEKGLVDQRITTMLAEMLQTTHRNNLRDNKKDAALAPILEFADQLVADIRAGKIWPSAVASLRLISLCKETQEFDRGKKYWKTLSGVEGALDAGVYGSYIEFMAEEGVATLAEMEAVYEEGLGRFPGTFAAYHLSHNAILPDRKRTTNFVGMSAHLLQGIVTARLMKGDWKNAYLALDTAFRIWPTQIPARFIHLIRTFRPPVESYRVFMMACRSGADSISARDAVIQTNLLRDFMRVVPLEQRPEIFIKTLDIFHAFVGYGAPATHYFITSLMKNLEALVPSSYSRTPEGQKVADLIAQTARELYDDMDRAGMRPQVVTLASRIHLIGKTMNVKELGLAMKQMKHMRPSSYGSAGSLERNVLLAAGKIQHKELIVEAWCDLKAALPAVGYEEYYALAVACRDADYKAFFWEEYTAASRRIPGVAQDSIMFQLDWAFDPSKQESHEVLPLETVQNTMREAKDKIQNTIRLLRADKALNFNNYPVPTDMDGVRLGSEEAMRVVYDKLTLDLLAPPPQEDVKYQQMLTSATGIPLGELRFKNWVMMTELLKLAEMYEVYKADSVDGKAKPWLRPPPGLNQSPINDPDELLAEVRRLRNLDGIPLPPDVYPDHEARREEVRRSHQMKI
ncbi:hypothetical protein IWZ01DRAFT_68829 [Phyllosticta capitalensis]